MTTLWKVLKITLKVGTAWLFHKAETSVFYIFISFGAKLLNADFLWQGIFLNHEGSFGNQEGMITWCWLAELACIKLVSHLKQIFEKKFQKHIAPELNAVDFFVLSWLTLLVSQVSFSA